MGWKTLKNAFGITHTVCVTDQGICIGSGYIHNILTINTTTGLIVENEATPGFVARTYPSLASAKPADLLNLISAKDQFEASITVYTYTDGTVLEKQCERVGYPNVTHDGDLMYENHYSTDRNEVVRWAKANARFKVEHCQDHLTQLHQQIAKTEKNLASAMREDGQLETDYPTTPTPS